MAQFPATTEKTAGSRVPAGDRILKETAVGALGNGLAALVRIQLNTAGNLKSNCRIPS
jgi:hypothetical protein